MSNFWFSGTLQDADELMTEFEMMATLMSQPGRIFSRTQLLNDVHGVAFGSYERTIDSHIRNLRHKLEPDELIFTVYGVGYKFEA